jgi:hypothetical protein
MKRLTSEAATMRDVLRVAVGLPLGLEGGYFVGGIGFAGQDLDASVVDSGTPPAGQPSLWCPWAPTMLDGGIGWVGDGSDSYVEWLEYLIAHFLRTWGYTLHGWLPFQGDYAEDAGTLIVRANQVEVRYQPVPKKRRGGRSSTSRSSSTRRSSGCRRTSASASSSSWP